MPWYVAWASTTSNGRLEVFIVFPLNYSRWIEICCSVDGRTGQSIAYQTCTVTVRCPGHVSRPLGSIAVDHWIRPLPRLSGATARERLVTASLRLQWTINTNTSKRISPQVMLIIKHQNPFSQKTQGPFSLQSPRFWWLMTTQPKQENITNISTKICNLLARMHECSLKVRLWT
jgi:hypothetical protein